MFSTDLEHTSIAINIVIVSSQITTVCEHVVSTGSLLESFKDLAERVGEFHRGEESLGFPPASVMSSSELRTMHE